MIKQLSLKQGKSHLKILVSFSHNYVVFSLIFLFFLFITRAQSKSQQKYLQGVIIFNEQNFNQALSQFQILVVSFEEQNCQYCSQFKLTYAMIAEQYNQNLASKKQRNRGTSREGIQMPLVQFGKLKFNQQTSIIFKQHSILTVPSVKIFYNAKLLPHQFQSLDYDDQIIEDLIEWIVRSLTQIQQIQQIESLPEDQVSIVINCESQYLKKFNQLRNKKMKYSFFCSHQRQVTGKNQVSIYQKNSKIYSINISRRDTQKGIQFQEKQNKPNIQTHQNQNFFQEKFQRFFDRQIYYWNNQMVHDVFSKNKSAFILIINNQTKSQNVFQLYQGIKNEFNQNNQIPSTRFIVSNLAQTTQQTTKIKKYLLGSAVSASKNYSYPILAYVRMGNYYRVSKYIFMSNVEQMKSWMLKVAKSLQLKRKLLETQEETKQQFEVQSQVTKQKPVQQWFNTSPQSIFKAELTPKSIQPQNNIRALSYKDFKLLLTSKNSTQPFFVYFSWRNDFQSVVLGEDIRQWWVNQQSRSEKERQQSEDSLSNQQRQEKNQFTNQYSKVINMYVFNLNFNDYPNFQNLEVKYVPSLFYFSADKKIQKLHGITQGLSQVKQFVSQHVILQQQKDKHDKLEIEQLEENKLKAQQSTPTIINLQKTQNKDQQNKIHQIEVRKMEQNQVYLDQAKESQFDNKQFISKITDIAEKEEKVEIFQQDEVDNQEIKQLQQKIDKYNSVEQLDNNDQRLLQRAQQFNQQINQEEIQQSEKQNYANSAQELDGNQLILQQEIQSKANQQVKLQRQGQIYNQVKLQENKLNKQNEAQHIKKVIEAKQQGRQQVEELQK